MAVLKANLLVMALAVLAFALTFVAGTPINKDIVSGGSDLKASRIAQITTPPASNTSPPNVPAGGSGCVIYIARDSDNVNGKPPPPPPPSCGGPSGGAKRELDGTPAVERVAIDSPLALEERKNFGWFRKPGQHHGDPNKVAIYTVDPFPVPVHDRDVTNSAEDKYAAKEGFQNNGYLPWAEQKNQRDINVEQNLQERHVPEFHKEPAFPGRLWQREESSPPSSSASTSWNSTAPILSVTVPEGMHTTKWGTHPVITVFGPPPTQTGVPWIQTPSSSVVASDATTDSIVTTSAPTLTTSAPAHENTSTCSPYFETDASGFTRVIVSDCITKIIVTTFEPSSTTTPAPEPTATTSTCSPYYETDALGFTRVYVSDCITRIVVTTFGPASTSSLILPTDTPASTIYGGKQYTNGGPPNHTVKSRSRKPFLSYTLAVRETLSGQPHHTHGPPPVYYSEKPRHTHGGPPVVTTRAEYPTSHPWHSLSARNTLFNIELIENSVPTSTLRTHHTHSGPPLLPVLTRTEHFTSHAWHSLSARNTLSNIELIDKAGPTSTARRYPHHSGPPVVGPRSTGRPSHAVHPLVARTTLETRVLPTYTPVSLPTCTITLLRPTPMAQGGVKTVTRTNDCGNFAIVTSNPWSGEATKTVGAVKMVTVDVCELRSIHHTHGPI